MKLTVVVAALILVVLLCASDPVLGRSRRSATLLKHKHARRAGQDVDISGNGCSDKSNIKVCNNAGTDIAVTVCSGTPPTQTIGALSCFCFDTCLNVNTYTVTTVDGSITPAGTITLGASSLNKYAINAPAAGQTGLLVINCRNHAFPCSLS